MEPAPVEELDFLRTRYLPPGFRFGPSDEGLLAYYLSGKLGGNVGGETDEVPFYDVLVPTVDLYGAYPWRVCQELAYPYGVGTTEFYCFTTRRRRYGGCGGSNPDRTVGLGTWVACGHDKRIYHRGVLIGHKACLTFKIRPPGSDGGTAKKAVPVNTHWIMHEYRLERPGFQEMVLCRVHNLKKEYEDANRLWTPPWWERVEEDCISDGSCADKRRKLRPFCAEPVVLTQQPRQRPGRRDSEGKRPAIAAPPGDAVIMCLDDFELPRKPNFMALLPLAGATSTSAAAFPEGPRYSASSWYDTDELVKFFPGELGRTLLGPAQGGMYLTHYSAGSMISSCSGVLPLHQQVMQEGILCSVPTDGCCNGITPPEAAVLAEPSAVLTAPSLRGLHSNHHLHAGDSNERSYTIPPMEEDTSTEAGSMTSPYGYLCVGAEGYITFPDASDDCSIPNMEEPLFDKHVGSDPAGQVCQSQLLTSPDAAAGNSCSIPNYMQQQPDCGNVTAEAVDELCWSQLTCTWKDLINPVAEEDEIDWIEGGYSLWD